MQASYTNKLILFPRIRKEVKNSLSMVENLNIVETGVKMSKNMGEIQTIIIELIHS